MIVDKVGKYKTNKVYSGRTLTSVWTIPSGTEFTVDQIDDARHMFWSNMFGEWSYWDKDVEYVGEL